MNKEKIKSELVEINNGLERKIEYLEDVNFKLTNKNIEIAEELAEVKVWESNREKKATKYIEEIKELKQKNSELNKKITDLHHIISDRAQKYHNLVTECAEVKSECEEWERAKYRVEDIKDKALEINNIKSDENKKLNLLILESKDKIETMIGEKQEDERRRVNAIVKYNRLKASIKKEFEYISIKLDEHEMGDVLGYLGACDGRITIEQVERFAKYSEDVSVYRCLEGIIKSDNLKNK